MKLVRFRLELRPRLAVAQALVEDASDGSGSSMSGVEELIETEEPSRCTAEPRALETGIRIEEHIAELMGESDVILPPRPCRDRVCGN